MSKKDLFTVGRILAGKDVLGNKKKSKLEGIISDEQKKIKYFTDQGASEKDAKRFIKKNPKFKYDKE